ncbi:hypothetical protein Back11_16400 [Paenibacillus baekrokdamisoli]|uniref:Uncharacterized protein n=1 Tax=Paenibacillus baekrokdamisoli TaxID=1712516 RepID=A0A3G9IVX2_9BACL|nr:immunoglobulin-like domain-containing protein [Paenibacillus baekrokdamisoli]MBB3071990.1 hypothetical protein [Paenibacillus baekrokdamisoli]BBH20295.1 hypothetical protein Back11_16400 [Paenibacillus baekrokdamisoli]
MKKWTALLVILSLFVCSTTTMAHGNRGNHNHENACKKVEDRMLHSLKKVKDEKERAALKSKIEEIRKKCESDANQGQWSDQKRVNSDKNELQIRYTNNDYANVVTGPLMLSQLGTNGSIITWSSNKPATISNNGLTVNRPQDKDEKVVLTATIRYNQASSNKSFTVLVKSITSTITDAQKLAKDKEALNLSFNGTDTANNVTQKLKPLPAKGANGSTIIWYSGNASVISSDGQTVNRPAAGSGDSTIILTALINNNNAADVKVFTITVKQQVSDTQKVAEDKAALEIDFGGDDNASRVTRALDKLPTKGNNGSVITWTSSSPAILSNDGKTINRPALGTGDATVVMTAFININGTADVKVFVLTVKPSLTSSEAVSADKTELAIKFKDQDNASSVTQSIILPTKGSYGSSITWYSSMTSVISDKGTLINRPGRGKGDVMVTMIAIISSGSSADLKTFTLTVKQQY